MFRSKRNSLVKRLWKHKVNDETKSSTKRGTAASYNTSSTSSSAQEDLDLKSVTHSFFKRLREDQLEVLLGAMESKGGEITPCVPVCKSDLRLGRRTVSPYVLCCRIFRWPDLKSDVEMKRLPSCMRQNEDRESVICCNPYHWSLVVKIDELPTPPYKIPVNPNHSHRMCAGDRDKEHSELSQKHDCLLWCTVAYWELHERIGRLFPVNAPSVNIFQHLPHGDGMCLRLFQKPTNIEAVKRTREKIGFGIILSREAAHESNVNVFEEEERHANDSPTATEIFVLPLPPSDVSPSLSQPPCLGGSGKCVESDYVPATSDCEKVSQPYSTADVLDVYDVLGDVTDCDNKESHHNADGCGTHHTEHQQHCNSYLKLSRHLCAESMDYISTGETQPPQHYTQPQTAQSMSPSSPSSSVSSLSSPPPSSPLMDSSNTSTNDLDYSSEGSKFRKWDSTEFTPHLSSSIMEDKNGSCIHNKSSSSKKTATETYTDSNSKNGRILSPGLTTRCNTISSTINTSTTNDSSSLPCCQGEIWAYNASNYPIFVNSPTLDDPRSPRSLVVKKVLPGHSIKIFDYTRAKLLERTEARNLLLNDGPFDPCSVRISLAKGWGPSYSRQFITSCPCWLEVLLGVRSNGSVS